MTAGESCWRKKVTSNCKNKRRDDVNITHSFKILFHVTVISSSSRRHLIKPNTRTFLSRQSRSPEIEKELVKVKFLSQTKITSTFNQSKELIYWQ